MFFLKLQLKYVATNKNYGRVSLKHDFSCVYGRVF